MVEKDLNYTVVLPIHKHSKARLLYIPTNLKKLIPENASLIEVELKRVIA
ncbi:MAG TPA: hypothetical protein VMV95_03710 [Bacillota bacterium]|nr:hypothetical protein [Bacillota bacterium]